MNKHALALVVAAASALTVTANSASANIAIGLSETIGGVETPIITVVSNVANLAAAAGTFGPNGFLSATPLQVPSNCTGAMSCNDFSFLATGIGSPPLVLPALLNTNTNIVVQDGGVTTNPLLPRVLNVYVTEFNNLLPTGSNIFGNTMTTNNQTAGTHLVTAAWQDNNNGLFTTFGPGVTSLGNHTFNGPLAADTFGPVETSIAMLVPYSVTTRFTFAANAVGNSANSTIDVTVPGPIAGAGLPGLIAACIGLIGLARRRRQKTA